MQDRDYPGIRVVDVAGLGYPATFVEMDDETLLLVEVSLTREQRIAVLGDAMAQASA